MLQRRHGARFPSDVMLSILAKEFNQTKESCFSRSESPLGAFWQTPSRLSCAFYWGEASVWPLYHKGLIGGVLQWWLCFWKVLTSPQGNSGALSEWPLVLGHLLDQCHSVPIAQFGQSTSSRKSLGGSKRFLFWYPCPDLCLDTILSWSSTNNYFNLMAWFMLWHALSTVGPYTE